MKQNQPGSFEILWSRNLPENYELKTSFEDGEKLFRPLLNHPKTKITKSKTKINLPEITYSQKWLLLSFAFNFFIL